MSIQFGVSTLIDFDVPFERRLDLIRAAGIRRIAISDERKIPLAQPDILVQVKKAIGLRKLSVDHLHGPISPRLDFTLDDPDITDATLAVHRQAVRSCVELGTQYLVVHVSSYPDLAFADLGEATKRTTGRLLDLIDYARPYGVEIVIENQPYIYRSQRLIDNVIEEFPAEELKICLDTCHIQIGNPEPLDFVKRWADHIVTTHLSDSDGLGDDHLIPGTNGFAWHECMAILKRAGRLRCLMFENSSWGSEPFEPYLDRTVDAGRWLCEMWESIDQPVKGGIRQVRAAGRA
ncbi:MAG: sugar phosphate isomerase/epimerase [bacterium]|jgi:sugar phosphate isomerase/epimerase